MSVLGTMPEFSEAFENRNLSAMRGKENKRRMIMPGCEKSATTRTLWVCDYPDCGEGYCCTIPSLKPSNPLWCDNPCRFVGTDQCTKHKPHKKKFGKCPKHFE